ncbi:transglutaminase domain-containing protein [bacterium]|nr:transglutaminase domain-containing protein [bacterium]
MFYDRRSTLWGKVASCLLPVLCAMLLGSCEKRDEYGVLVGDSGLKPGINYMQPNKWEITYRYKVKEIIPTRISRDKKPAAIDSGTPVVGPGTFEVWLCGPMACDEVRDVKLTYVNPEPTAQEYDEDQGITYLYYDFAPDNRLPHNFAVEATWTCYTFERYTHWKDIEEMIKPYDKESEIYKRYTQEEYPIVFHKGLNKDAKDHVNVSDPDDIIGTCLNIYNDIVVNYNYDFLKMGYSQYGEDGLLPTDRVWINKRGVCDEFANIFCAMARVNGIPARPCAGISHYPSEGGSAIDYNENGSDNYIGLELGQHAWAEFYLEGVGWIPVDPTWADDTEKIHKVLSPMGAKRGITYPDYYFGKLDPFRITLYKGWNYHLKPEPRTPDADPVQDLMIMGTARHSNVKDMVYGFDWSELLTPEELAATQYMGLEVASVSNWEMNNMDYKVTHLSEMPKEELDPIIAEIRAEGHNYVQVPQFPWVNSREQMTDNSW